MRVETSTSRETVYFEVVLAGIDFLANNAGLMPNAG